MRLVAKSKRNKTIELSKGEVGRLEKKLVTLSCPVTKEQVVGKTILQNTFDAIGFLPDIFIDLLFADPPYNMHKMFGQQTFRKMNDNEYAEWLQAWVEKIYVKLKPDASIYVCSDWQTSHIVQKVLSGCFFVRNRITWQREKGRGAKTNWKSVAEDIWFATMSEDYHFDADAVKTKKKVIAPYKDRDGVPKDWFSENDKSYRLTHPSNLWTDITVPFWSMPENTNHPTQKPEKLLAKVILASSEENDVVFDPFLGSGTTSVVAKKLGRKYAGIEIDMYYACLAEKRLEMADHDNRIQGYSDGVFLERNERN